MLGFGQKPENERNPENGVLMWTYGLRPYTVRPAEHGNSRL